MDTPHIYIKKIRLLRGHVQEYVADRLYLSVKAYQNIEQGKSKIDLQRLQQLLDILNFPIITFVQLHKENYSELLQIEVITSTQKEKQRK